METTPQMLHSFRICKYPITRPSINCDERTLEIWKNKHNNLFMKIFEHYTDDANNNNEMEENKNDGNVDNGIWKPHTYYLIYLEDITSIKNYHFDKYILQTNGVKKKVNNKGNYVKSDTGWIEKINPNKINSNKIKKIGTKMIFKLYELGEDKKKKFEKIVEYINIKRLDYISGGRKKVPKKKASAKKAVSKRCTAKTASAGKRCKNVISGGRSKKCHLHR